MSWREIRVNLLISMGHTLSHFYFLCLPPLFIAWQRDFAVSYAELGVVVVVMGIASATLQTPFGFLVDRYGARWFLIGGTLLLSLTIGGMAYATSFWQILVLATLFGVANAVFHPADYSILAGSIAKERIGRAFALHSFTGNLGFALAPPVVAAMMLFMGWRPALLILGGVGVLVACALVWQRAVLQDETRREKKKESRLTLRDLVFDRTMFLFFMFFLLGAMATSGVQAWLITVLHEVKGIEIALASTALTAYMVGAAAGVLCGGWATDMAKSTNQLAGFIVGLTVLSALAVFFVGIAPVTGVVAIGAMFFAGLCYGGSRTPRDVMLKDAAPPGEIGKVFGYISASLFLGSALVPVPFGLLIDHGHPELVLVFAAVLMAGSLLCLGPAKASMIKRAAPVGAQ